MKNSKILIATLAGGVVLFLLGWLLYGMVFSGFFKSQGGTAVGVDKDMADLQMHWIFLGNLAYGLFLSLLLGTWAKVTDLIAGIRVSVIAGFLVEANFGLVMHGTTNLMKMVGIIADVFVSAAMSGIAGAVIAYILLRKEKV